MAMNDTALLQIIIDPKALAEFVNSPNGPVIRSLAERGTKVQTAARNQIRFGHVHGGNGRPNLKDTIVKRFVNGEPTPVLRVGSDSPIARLHHDGTRPHIIRPREKKVLVFDSQRSKSTVYAKIVHHPGTRPNRYLTDNLHLAL